MGPSEQLDLNDQMTRRREELEAIRKLGLDPYPYSFNRTAYSREIIASFVDDALRRIVAIAGRIMSIRKASAQSSSKAAFDLDNNARLSWLLSAGFDA